MKVGDLIRERYLLSPSEEQEIGIIINIQDDKVVPPAVSIMWSSGNIFKEWSDDIEVIRD